KHFLIVSRPAHQWNALCWKRLPPIRVLLSGSARCCSLLCRRAGLSGQLALSEKHHSMTSPPSSSPAAAPAIPKAFCLLITTWLPTPSSSIRYFCSAVSRKFSAFCLSSTLLDLPGRWLYLRWRESVRYSIPIRLIHA